MLLFSFDDDSRSSSCSVEPFERASSVEKEMLPVLLATTPVGLPEDDEALTQQTRAERAAALREARDRRRGHASVFTKPNPQTTWYLWPQETSCVGVVGEWT